jgi:rhodanese-related sulfurtransferase
LASLYQDQTVRVDATMETTLPDVFACGSAVSVPHAVTGRPVWPVQPSVIERSARVAGHNAARSPGALCDELRPISDTAVHRIGDLWLARTGLSEGEARSSVGVDRVCVVTVHGPGRERWLAAEDTTIRLVVDRKTRTIIGGEAWGHAGVVRRIDLIAAAVTRRWTTADLSAIDASYEPSLGPAQDPLDLAAVLAGRVLSGETTLVSPDVLGLTIGQGGAIQIVDVGRPEDAGSTPWPDGTRHIPLEGLREGTHDLDAGVTTILLSHSGRRAVLAASVLRQRGFLDVKALDGGMATLALFVDDTRRDGAVGHISSA